MAGFLILIGGSAIMGGIGWLIRRVYGMAPPLWIAPVYLLCVVAVGVKVVFPFVLGMTPLPGVSTVSVGAGYGTAMVRLCFALLVYYYPIVVAATLGAEAIAEGFVTALYGSSLITPLPSRYGKAYALAKQGSIISAVRQFRTYFDENPRVPAPLFAAARMLIADGQYPDAALMYQEILQHFPRSAKIWAEAATGLANLYEYHMQDRASAENVLREIIKRIPTTPQAHAAVRRITGSRPTDMPPSPEPPDTPV